MINPNVTASHPISVRLRHGLIAGLVGAFTIWIYEFIVLYGALRNTTAAGVVQHTALLVFGLGNLSSGLIGFGLGLVIHCLTAIVWAVIFALIWPWFKAQGWEASLTALPFGAFAWVVMHLVVLALLSPDPPVYTTYVVINGLMSHMVALCVPVALVVKYLDAHR